MKQNSFWRRSLRLLMAVLVFVSLSPTSLRAAEDWSYDKCDVNKPFGGGSGYYNDPYRIETAQQLVNLAYKVTQDGMSYAGSYFRLMNDIVLNDDVIAGAIKEADGSIRYDKNKAHFDKMKAWQPIGMYGRLWHDYFKGVFDGGGHSISGIYFRKPVETSDKAYVFAGLFACIDNATIQNLTIKDSFFSISYTKAKTGSRDMGCLVGYAKSGTIANCHVENCVISSDTDVYGDGWNIGGLVGEVKNAFGANGCSFDGVIDLYTISQIEGGCYYAGGILGGKHTENELTIENCRTKGKLMCREKNTESITVARLGGIVGYSDSNTEIGKNKMTRCINQMDISAYADGSVYRGATQAYVNGISTGSAVCTECANYGNLNVGGTTYRANEQDGKYGYITMSGICQTGNAIDCFNYGNISIAPMKYSNNTIFFPFICNDGDVTDCFNNNIETFHFDNSYFVPGPARVRYNNVKYCISRNGTEISTGINKADFTSEDYMEALNKAAGSSKYGIIKDSNHPFNGYLSLTSLGALSYLLAGQGTEASPFMIHNATDLRTLAYMYTTDNDYNGKYFRMDANIDMSNEPVFDGIGSYSRPFDGIFDGAGHYIRGLRAKDGSFFYGIKGIVRNLALDDFQSLNGQVFGPFAYSLKNGGILENCYAFGDADLKIGEMYETSHFGGICVDTEVNSKVDNCYYIGNVKITNPLGHDLYWGPTLVGGIAERVQGKVSNCYTSFTYDTGEQSSMVRTSLGGITTTQYSDNGQFSNNYSHYEIAASAQQPTVQKVEGETVVESESDLDAAALGSAWLKGMRHPVLKSAYHYDCKDYNGQDACLDPLGYTSTSNDILTLVPTAGQKDDTKMWLLPNVAVYSEDLDADCLSSFNIIPCSYYKRLPLRYKPSKEGVRLTGTVNYPWLIKKGLMRYSFCLPGSVNVNQLPEGSKLYVGGTLTDNPAPDFYRMNIVEVDEVPAGVPFFLEYDNQGEERTYNISMTGDLAMTPQKASEASSLRGSYSYLPDEYYNRLMEDYDGNLVMVHEPEPVYGFEAYLPFKLYHGNVNIDKYLLLSEQGNNTDEVLAVNDGNEVSVKLRRNLKAGEWNTLCLPFDMSASDLTRMLGEGTIIEEPSELIYDASTNSLDIKFRKLDASDELGFGKPYMVFSTSNTEGLLDMGNVALYSTTNPLTVDCSENGYVFSVMGTYGKVNLLSTDEEEDYTAEQNNLSLVGDQPVSLLGYRFWIKVAGANGQKVKPLSGIRLIHSDGSVVTNVEFVKIGQDSNNARIYDLQGIQHQEMQKGLNIVGGKKIMKR